MKLPSPPSLLIKLLGIILEEIPSERLMVLMVNEKKQLVFKKSPKNVRIENGDISSRIIKKALDEMNPVMINALSTDHRFRDSESVNFHHLESVLCLPLIIKNKAAGAIYLDRKAGLGPFSKQNLDFLIAISKPISLVLGNSPNFQRLKDRPSHDSELTLFGPSKAFRDVLILIDKVKDKDTPIFIWGESGTGKELVARAIHWRGARKKGKFLAVNCGAIPDHLLESELFGYVKGAFTGAVRNKPGLIEEADGGTFFFDEIGDLSPRLQAKLLRILEEKEIRRIGENQTRSVNVRFISATNKNIEKEIDRGNFREDLYYRLKIITIELSPLRERKEDLIFLLNHFVEKYCREMSRDRVYFSPRALELLMNYSWPGNVRELQNEIQRCLILSGEDCLIKEEYLSPTINPQKENSTTSSYYFSQAKAEFEKRFINQALARCNYKKAKTAEEIGLSRQGLFKLIKKHKIWIPKGKENGEIKETYNSKLIYD